ncbi:DUF397 domain-containing protein [Streptomyces sanglieri]|uniref:DUF397 domain-containing protein n=1 Tax=Streptomyces sanglieri TaxID=193460 RepID=UPI003523E9A5
MSTARAWFRSGCGGDEGGACVEATAHPAAVHVRDSKSPEGPALAAFTARVGR